MSGVTVFFWMRESQRGCFTSSALYGLLFRIECYKHIFGGHRVIQQLRQLTQLHLSLPFESLYCSIARQDAWKVVSASLCRLEWTAAVADWQPFVLWLYHFVNPSMQHVQAPLPPPRLVPFPRQDGGPQIVYALLRANARQRRHSWVAG